VLLLCYCVAVAMLLLMVLFVVVAVAIAASLSTASVLWSFFRRTRRRRPASAELAYVDLVVNGQRL
jgi:uncharacterized protein HemY